MIVIVARSSPRRSSSSSAGCPTRSAGQDHDGGLPARGGDLLPAVPGHDALRQSGARGVAGGRPDDGRGRSGDLQRSRSSSDRASKFTRLRPRARTSLPSSALVQHRERAAPATPIVVEGRQRQFTAGTPDFVTEPRRRRSPSTAIRRRPIRPRSTGDDRAAADHPGDLRHHGVRADRRLAGRAVPDPHPLHGMSLPYHIGNGWFGGFLPATVFAIVAATGKSIPACGTRS